MVKKKHRAANFYNDGIKCHLCGLPIPWWIVSPKHPLSGTIDHVVPKSLGGLDRASNRAPSHGCCNHHRGVRNIDENLRKECLELSVGHFVKLEGIPTSKRWKLVRTLIKKAGRSRAA